MTGDRQRFYMEAIKYRGGMATSMGQAAEQRMERPFKEFGKKWELFHKGGGKGIA
jgi:hypothetical protein